MGKNKQRSGSDRGDNGEEPVAKKPNLDIRWIDLSNEDVEILRLRDLAIHMTHTTYKSKGVSLSTEETRNRIKSTEEVSVGPKDFFLYPAFQEALVKILQEIKNVENEEKCETQAILIHGVPNVGKSSLSYCLSHFLAFVDGAHTVHHIQLYQSEKHDINELTQFVTDNFKTKYLIFDQVNLNNFTSNEFMKKAENRFLKYNNRVPIIMFTSGHYSPPENWLRRQNSRRLLYKIINLKIDDAVVNMLKKHYRLPETGVVSNEDLLRVTCTYSRMDNCLDYLRDEPEAQTDALRQHVFPGAYLNNLKMQNALHFLWLAWYHLMKQAVGEKLTYAEFTEEHCKMEPHHAEYLGYLISDSEDVADRGKNAILNEVDIAGEIEYEKDGYYEVKPVSYYYKFMNPKHLYDILREAISEDKKCSPAQRLNALVEAYNHLTLEGTSQHQFTRGRLFEVIIHCICDKAQNTKEDQVGMMYTSPGINFVDVSARLVVATEQELCEIPEKHHQNPDVEAMTFFCELNAPGKIPFRGYDFAYLRSRRNGNKLVVDELQLFQVTVNPQGQSAHKKSIMVDVFENIKIILLRKSLIKHDGAQVIIPYFLQPSDPKPEVEKDILRSRDSDKSIEAYIIGFPQKYFTISH